MFLRTKSVKGTPLVQLVESFRNAEGQPRRRVVASLGDVTIPDDQRKIIAKAVEHELTGHPELFTQELSTEVVQLGPQLAAFLHPGCGAACRHGIRRTRPAPRPRSL